MRRWLLLGLIALTPAAALAQSASEVERCFQNPGSCSSSGGAPCAAPPRAGACARRKCCSRRPAPAPDYATVLNSPEPDRRKLQESLRTLDKYSGPIDGNLQSEATTKGISDWQKRARLCRHRQADAERGGRPQQRGDQGADPAARSLGAGRRGAAAPPSNADALKSLRARLAERRKAAEPKANAAAQALVADLKAYVAADGKGPAGEQFAAFAKWYADTKAAGRTVGDIKPAVEDYGDAKAGAAATAEVSFETKQGDKSTSQCLVFAWVEASPRKNAQAFSCDDVAAVEKWKTDQALRSAWR